jgi:N-acetylneuraminic acid mutarotase
LPVAAGQVAAAAHGGLIYAIGGIGKAGHSLAQLQIYNPAKNGWTQGAPMPTARGLAQATWCGGRMYVIGGVTTPEETRVAAVESYNPKTNTWRKLAPVPIPRAHPAVGTVDGDRVIVAGGGVSSHKNISDVEIYNPAKNTWQRGSDLKRADSGGPSGAVIDGNRFFVVGGFSGPSLHAIDSVQWAAVS